MMSNNKILTVSYGTFSCTLEGFDESFETMKAIAEYFRDLAADDRYFGAEPPQPDAEMLARIAEREIARRVEAHASEAGIHLRAGKSMAAIEDGQAAADQRPTHVPAADKPHAEQTAETLQDAPVAHAEDTAPEAEVPAERRQPVGEADRHTDRHTNNHSAGFIVHQAYDQHLSAAMFNPTLAAIAQTGQSCQAPAGDEGKVDGIAPAADPEPVFTPAPAEEEPAPNGDGAAEFFARAARPGIPVAEDVRPPVKRLEPNSIADKLQRIRAVVSKSQPAPQTFSEDEHAEEILDEDKVDSTILTADFFSKTDAAPESDGSDEETEFAAAEFVPDAEIGPRDVFETANPSVTVGDEDADMDEGDDAHEFHHVAESDADDDADLAATLARIGADFEDDETAGAPVGNDALSEEESAASEHDYDFSSLFADDEDEDDEGADETGHTEGHATVEASQTEAPAQEPAIRARVIKVKRSEVRAAMDAGMLERDAVDAEMLTGAFDDGAMDEDELDRLMIEADQKMDDPETSDRRAAFDQMRAAVDATKDDADLGTDEEEDDAAEYRTDFAEAVKPRRPIAGVRTDRPRDQRPAPLKLVAEQRVDLPTVKSGPVQPRRVAATAHPETGEGEGGFADYARSLGAHDLPDLLEAAASYLSFVEGRDQFSRPQLMTKVRQLDPEGFSREDGLRHFGQLLRAGKIEKIKGGRFTVSDDIGFRPDGKRAAG